MQLNWDLRDSDQVKSELTTGKLMPFGDGFIETERERRDADAGTFENKCKLHAFYVKTEPADKDTPMDAYIAQH